MLSHSLGWLVECPLARSVGLLVSRASQITSRQFLCDCASPSLRPSAPSAERYEGLEGCTTPTEKCSEQSSARQANNLTTHPVPDENVRATALAQKLDDLHARTATLCARSEGTHQQRNYVCATDFEAAELHCVVQRRPANALPQCGVVRQRGHHRVTERRGGAPTPREAPNKARLIFTWHFMLGLSGVRPCL